MTPAMPKVTTDISNYADTGHGDPHKAMIALTWQAPNRVKLRKFAPTTYLQGFLVTMVRH